MKTRFFTFLLLTFLLSVMAQAQIPNPGFENWTTSTKENQTIRDPEGWYTPNTLSVFFGEPEMAKQTADAYEGSSALMLMNLANERKTTSFALTFKETAKGENDDKFPVSGKVTAFKGFYKYTYTAPSDSCRMMILLFRNGVTVGSGEFTSGEKVSDYTSFTAPIEYYQDSLPDAATINIFTSVNDFHEGTVLTIDALSLVTPQTGFDDVEEPVLEASVYPNPVYGIAGVQFKQLQQGKTSIAVYNVLGTLVQTLAADEHFAAGTHNVDWDTETLPAGMYFVKVTQDSLEKTIKVLLK